MLGMTKAKLMKYAFSKIIRRPNTTGKNMNELENLPIEMTKTETWKSKATGVKSIKKGTFKNYGKICNDLVYVYLERQARKE